jgi:hypothetical protein
VWQNVWSGVEWRGVEWGRIKCSGVEWSGVGWSGVAGCEQFKLPVVKEKCAEERILESS